MNCRPTPPPGSWAGTTASPKTLFQSDPALGLTVSDTGVQFQDHAIPAAGHSTVAIRRHPANVNKAVGWIVVDPAPAFPGIASKLPHYGRYSYLAFEGDEPANIASGEWANNDSPLRADLRSAEQRAAGPVTPRQNRPANRSPNSPRSSPENA